MKLNCECLFGLFLCYYYHYLDLVFKCCLLVISYKRLLRKGHICECFSYSGSYLLAKIIFLFLTISLDAALLSQSSADIVNLLLGRWETR